MPRMDYRTHSLTATTSPQTLVFTRSGEQIQIRNMGGNPVKIILRTPDNRTDTFDTSERIITLGSGNTFDDNLLVEEILYKTTSGTSTIEVYISW